jgi:hypothetical protein
MDSFLNFVSDLFSTSLKDYSDQLVNDKYKGKVKVLVEIFQATNPNYKSPKISSGDYFTDGGGVCHAMCLSWFRDNHEMGGGEAFREMIGGNWNHFVVWQCEIDTRRDEYAQLKVMNAKIDQEAMTIKMTAKQWLTEIDLIGKRCLELKGKRTEAEEKEIPLLMQRMAKAEAKLKSAEVALAQNKLAIAEARATLKRIRRTIKEMVAAAVYDRPEDFNQMQKIVEDVPVANVTAMLQQCCNAPGLYMIEMGSGAAKHAVAIEAWGRFMDPNSCEYLFRDQGVMCAFIGEYFKTVYGKQYPTITLWSFAPPTPRPVVVNSSPVYVPTMGGDSAMDALLNDTIL